MARIQGKSPGRRSSKSEVSSDENGSDSEVKRTLNPKQSSEQTPKRDVNGRFMFLDDGLDGNGNQLPWAVGGTAVGRKTVTKVPVGGISVVGIDPGKTTGLAVYDAWDGRWYVDQLDAGRGRKVRHKVHGGFIESSALIDGSDELGLRLASGIQVVRGGGRKTKLAIDAVVERNVITTLLDVLLAVGPRTIVVVEDFEPGRAAGEGLQAVQLGRDGLSPVRLIARLMDRATLAGYWNGDAWRNFDCGWWAGGDGRGVQVATQCPVTGAVLGGVPSFRRRLSRTEEWRLGDAVAARGAGVVWGGGGAQLELRMPHQRLWRKGGAKAQEAWLRANGSWRAGLPHAMVAMQHAHAVGRGIGAADLGEIERIWHPAAKIRNGAKTAKSDIRP